MKYLALFLFLLLQNTLQAQNTTVTAHRGKASFVPENTIRGMKKLLPTGIKFIEIDVRTTKDSNLVIMHDASLKRTTNSKAKVGELTTKELKKVKVTGWFNIRFRKNTIPTLEEVCRLVKNWNTDNPERIINLYVDCKDANPQVLLETLNKFYMAHSSVFYGNDTYLKTLRDLDPKLKIMPGLKNENDLEVKTINLKPYAFDVSYASLTPELVERIHSHGILVFSDLLFIYDHKSAYRKAAKMGVDVIQTDRAKKALRVLRKMR